MAARQSKSGRQRRRSSGQPKAALNARGLRSRERLKQAARDVLNENGFRNIRIQDVTKRAGFASGLFYHYFRDLREVVAEVCSDFFDELVSETASLGSYEDPYDWIFENHRSVVERFAENPGTLACLFGLAGDLEEFDRIWKENAHVWNLQVADFLQEAAGFRKQNARGFAFVLGAMTEGVIYQTLIRRTEDLAEFATKPNEIAEAIAIMWYRAIFLEDPSPEKLNRPGVRLLGMRQVKKK